MAIASKLRHNNLDLTVGVTFSKTLPSFADTTLSQSALTRGISLDTDGTVTIVYANGVVDTLTMAAGIEHAIIGFTQISASTLTTAQIHVLY